MFKNSSNNDDSWTNVTVEADLDKPMPPPPPPAPPPPQFNNQIISDNSSIKDLINIRKKNNKNNKNNQNNKNNKNNKNNSNKGVSMTDVLNQLKNGSFKLKKTTMNNVSNKDKLMTEMEVVLKRRISLLDGQ